VQGNYDAECVTYKLPSHAKKIVITVSTRLPLIGFSSPAIKNPAKTKSASIKVILDSLHAFYDNLTLLSLLIKLRHPARFCHAKPGMIVCLSINPERSAKRAFGVASLLLLLADPLLWYNFAGQLARH
jgi:hypothetical protein